MPPCSSSIFPATNRTHPFIASIARADFSVCVRTSIRPLRDSYTLPIPYSPLLLFLPTYLPTYPSCPTAAYPSAPHPSRDSTLSSRRPSPPPSLLRLYLRYRRHSSTGENCRESRGRSTSQIRNDHTFANFDACWYPVAETAAHFLALFLSPSRSSPLQKQDVWWIVAKYRLPAPAARWSTIRTRDRHTPLLPFA